ncbi:MAG TPA: hypothetical protein DEP51_00910 [Clostridiales bacterium]|nr:hypothetical protein [Clostridiales bacterium]
MNEENNKANQVDFYELNNLNLKPKIKDKKIFIILTVLTAIIAFYGRLLTAGLLTALLLMPIVLNHFILFIISGIMLSNIKEKDVLDYLLFLILCLTMVVYSYTFVDFEGNGSVKVIGFIAENVLSIISSVCFIINVITAIISIIRCVYRNAKK